MLRGFVDPVTGQHTNNIESYWGRLKKDLWNRCARVLRDSKWMRKYLYFFQFWHNKKVAGMTDEDIRVEILDLLF